MADNPAVLSPYQALQQLLRGYTEPLDCTKATLVQFSHAIEYAVLDEQLPAIVIAGFQQQIYWEQSAERYAQLATVARAVCVMSSGDLWLRDGDGVLCVGLAEDDPLCNEWFVLVLSERFSAALCARDRRIPAVDNDLRQFIGLWSFAPEIVADVVDRLIAEIERRLPDEAAWLAAARAQIASAGGDIGLVGMIMRRIIHFEEQIHAALHASQARYRALTELISDFVVAIDVDLAQRQQITWVAGAFVATTGYDPADSGVLAGLGALVVADDQPIWHDHVRNVTAGRSDVCELRITTRSGHTCWMQIFSQPELNDRSPQSSIRIISAARDITPRKEAEAELQQANTQLKHWVANLEQRTREMTMLNEMGEWLQTCQLPEEAYGVIAQFGTQLFPGTSGAFYARQADQSESQVERVAFWGNAPPDEQLFGPDDCWGLRRGRPYLLHDGGTGVRCRHLPNLKWSGSLCIPLITQGDILGLLHLRQPADGSGRGAVNTFSDLHGLAIIAAEHFSLALANVQLRETLRQQAIRDPLTGLFNRRYMEESIEREVRRVERSRSALGVIMLDLDHFKSFNDTFTHLAGDLLLREIGLLLQRSIRSEDIACRYGGEEFTLILPDATLNDTIQRAEALRGQIKQLEVVYRGQPLGSISVSVGLAAYPDHGDTGEAVLRIADTALLRAKAAGRDQIRVGIE